MNKIVQNGKKVNQPQKKRGCVNLISFGVSSSSYFFFSFFRKTSQMINMTMRTPRDIPTTAPATLPTSLTSVNGKEKVMRDRLIYCHISFIVFILFYYLSQILMVHAHLPEILQHILLCHSAQIKFNTRAIKLFRLSDYDPNHPGPLRKCISVTVKHNCWSIGGDQWPPV